MGKRSRRQNSAAAPEPLPAGNTPRAKRERLKQRADVAMGQAEREIKDRPKAPWDPFPLTELAIFIGIVLLIVGALIGGGTGTGLIVAGVVLACIGGLDTALREHLNGYRSHAGLLAGIVALAGLVASSATGSIPVIVCAAIGVGIFAGLFPALRRDFLRRSGGRGVM